MAWDDEPPKPEEIGKKIVDASAPAWDDTPPSKDEIDLLSGLNQPSKLESAARGALQGATLGFSDEAIAGMRSIPSQYELESQAATGIVGETGDIPAKYKERIEQERTANTQARAANPLTYGASEIAGGLAIPAGAAGSVKGAAGIGALQGGIYSGGESTGKTAGEVATDVLKGGAIGGVAGGTVGAISKTLSPVILRHFAEKKAVGALKSAPAELEKAIQRLPGATRDEKVLGFGRWMLDNGLITPTTTADEILQKSSALAEKYGQETSAIASEASKALPLTKAVTTTELVPIKKKVMDLKQHGQVVPEEPQMKLLSGGDDVINQYEKAGFVPGPGAMKGEQVGAFQVDPKQLPPSQGYKTIEELQYVPTTKNVAYGGVDLSTTGEKLNAEVIQPLINSSSQTERAIGEAVNAELSNFQNGIVSIDKLRDMRMALDRTIKGTTFQKIPGKLSQEQQALIKARGILAEIEERSVDKNIAMSEQLMAFPGDYGAAKKNFQNAKAAEQLAGWRAPRDDTRPEIFMKDITAGLFGQAASGSLGAGAAAGIGSKLIRGYGRQTAAYSTDKLAKNIEKIPAKWRNTIADAAQRGSKSLSVADFVLQGTDPEYRMFREQYQMNEDSGR